MIVTVAALAHEVGQRAPGREQGASSQRYVVGIAGPPAAGKSTLAGCLRDEINAHRGSSVAEVAPMDGFHFTNEQLTARGALSRKGAPDTFDAAAFADALCAVRRGDVVAWPLYDRSLHEPVPAGVTFGHETKIVITEGNYLFLDSPGWVRVPSCLDEAWYLDAEAGTIEDRLLHRHVSGGKSRQAATVKVTSSDMPNARLIASTRAHAQMVLRAESGDYAVIQGFRPG